MTGPKDENESDEDPTLDWFESMSKIVEGKSVQRITTCPLEADRAIPYQVVIELEDHSWIRLFVTHTVITLSVARPGNAIEVPLPAPANPLATLKDHE